jgi:hypothetical protein
MIRLGLSATSWPQSADLYPAFAKKLAKLLSRVATGDREIEFINNHNLPKGTDRPLVAELKARLRILGR